MPRPRKYDRQYSFQNFQATNPSRPVPADRVDAEFNEVKLSLDQTQTALSKIQRDDGALANAVVTQDSLAPGLSIGFTFRGQWAPNTNYIRGDGVTIGSAFYQATSSLLSTAENRPDLAPDLWAKLADFTSATAEAQTAAEAARQSAERARALSLGLAPPGPKLIANLLGTTAEWRDTDVGDLGRYFGLAITRAQIPTLVMPLTEFSVAGYYGLGDLGAGARYKRGRGVGEIQDQAGTWFVPYAPNGVYDVGHYGAKGDGVADDGGAIILARDAIPATGGILHFPVPPAKYRVLGQLQIGDGSADMVTPSTKQNIFLRGGLPGVGTAGQLSNGLANRSNVEISYEGAAEIDSVVWFRGPISGGMSGLTLNGNGKSRNGVRLSAVFRSVFENLHPVNNYTSIRQDANGNAPVNTSIGSSENFFRGIQGDSFFINNAVPTCGVDIGYEASTSGASLDVNRDVWLNCSFLVNENTNSAGARLRGCDLVSFYNTFFYQGGDRLGASIEVVAPAGQPHLPCEVMFYNCPMYGRLRIKPNSKDGVLWNPDSNGGFGIGLFPYALGDAINPAHPGSADLNIQYGFYGYDDRGNEFGFFPQQRKYYGGYGHDAPASVARSGYNAVVDSSSEAGLATFTLLPRMMRARPQNLGAFTNAFDWNRKLRIESYGFFKNNTGSDQTIRFRLYVGSTVAFETGPVTIPSSSFNKAYSFTAKIAASSSSLFSKFAKLELYGEQSVGGAVGFVDAQRTVGGLSDNQPVDFTVQQQIRLTVQLSAASPQFLCAISDFDVEIV